MVLPVGYFEVMVLCMSFFVASTPGPCPVFRRLQKAGGAGNEASPTLLYCKRRGAGRGPGNEATFFDCKGYRVLLDSAVLGITGMTFLTMPNLIPSPPQ